MSLSVTVQSEDLTKGLKVASLAIAKHSSLPITSTVLLQTENGQLTISATNLEAHIATTIGAQIEAVGGICVEPKALLDAIKGVKGPVELYAGGSRSDKLQVVAGAKRLNLSGYPAEDFPAAPSLGTEPRGLWIDRKAFLTALQRTTLAAATDDSRPVLTGVHWAIEHGKVTLAAADGFRLAIQELVAVSGTNDPLECIVPARGLTMLQKAATQLKGDTDIHVRIAQVIGTHAVTGAQNVACAGKYIAFDLPSTTLSLYLLQGAFPNYPQLVPQTSEWALVVNRKALLEEVAAAAEVAKQSSGIIRLDAIQAGDLAGELHIMAQHDETTYNSQIPASIMGERGRIAFNGGYLLALLRSLDCDQVALEGSTPSSPGLFQVAGPGRSGFKCVVMPMYVQWDTASAVKPAPAPVAETKREPEPEPEPEPQIDPDQPIDDEDREDDPEDPIKGVRYVQTDEDRELDEHFAAELQASANRYEQAVALSDPAERREALAQAVETEPINPKWIYGGYITDTPRVEEPAVSEPAPQGIIASGYGLVKHDRAKAWGKVFSPSTIDLTQRGGWALGGRFVKWGEQVSLEPGEFLLLVAEERAGDRAVQHCAVVSSENRVVPLPSVPDPDWSQPVQDKATASQLYLIAAVMAQRTASAVDEIWTLIELLSPREQTDLLIRLSDLTAATQAA